MNWTYRVLAAVTPVLMVVVAGVQHWRVSRYQQTPWKGGGFGMFATSEHTDHRIVKMFIKRDSEWQPLVLTEDKLQVAASNELLAAPYPKSMSKFANVILAKLNDHAFVNGEVELKFEYWQMDYDGRGERIKAHQEATIEYRCGKVCVEVAMSGAERWKM